MGYLTDLADFPTEDLQAELVRRGEPPAPMPPSFRFRCGICGSEVVYLDEFSESLYLEALTSWERAHRECRYRSKGGT